MAEKGGLLRNWSYEDEWFEETNVSTKIKEFLEKSGYKIIKFNADKMARGPDIVGEKDSQRIIVEVKGYPSDKYVKDNPKRGIKKGDLKPTDPKLQAKHWVAELLLSLLIQKSKDPATLAMGLPKSETYQRLLDKIEYKKLGFICFIVDENGNVEIG